MANQPCLSRFCALRRVPRRSRPGFTLLELSIVITIIAVIAGMSVSMGSSMLESVRRVNTRNKLDQIEAALMAFRMAYDRLPCPGDATLTDIAANSTIYGYEAANNNNRCTGGSPAANYSATTSNNSKIPSGSYVAEGAVPVKTLGLPDEYQWDGWGRKFSYAVWAPLTGTRAFLTYGIANGCGGLTVKNAGGGNRSTAGAYVLMSYGPNGHGAYLKSGTRFFAGSDNADEQTNCHCNASADTGYTATYVQEDPTQTSSNDALSVYDDMVRYKERWQMQNDYDAYVPTLAGTCGSNGFRVDDTGTAGVGDQIGSTQVIGCDINGDGIDDLVIPSNNGGGTNDYYVIFGKATGYTNPFTISSSAGLDGTNGFVISGHYAGGMAACGDFNHDGIKDLLIGMDGSAAVIFGNSGGNPPWKTGRPTPGVIDTQDASWIEGTDGFNMSYSGNTSSFGGGGVGAGDLNGDGVDDIIISERSANTNKGYVFVLYGYTGVAQGIINFGSNPTNGKTIILNGVTWGFCDPTSPTGDACRATYPSKNTSFGANLTATLKQLAIDLNASANASINVAKYAVAYNTLSTTSTRLNINYKTAGVGGNAYTINKGTAANNLCGATCWTTNPTTLNASSGLWVEGDVRAYMDGMIGFYVKGTVANSAGFGWGLQDAVKDLNKDGNNDLIFSDNSGTVQNRIYVIYGPPSTWTLTNAALTLTPGAAPLDGTHGLTIKGPDATGGNFGGPLAVADFNGDGNLDIAASASESNVSGFNAGSVYILWGPPSNWGNGNTAETVRTNGYASRWDGSDRNSLGWWIAAGDINGDGLPDLLMASPGGDLSASPDHAYVIFGHSGAIGGGYWTTTPRDINATPLTSTEGFKIDCTNTDELSNNNYDSCGMGLGTADINGDGTKDILLGELHAKSQGVTDGGWVYVIYGKASGWGADYSLNNIYNGQ